MSLPLNLAYLGTETFHPARSFRILALQSLRNNFAHLVAESSRHPVTQGYLRRIDRDFILCLILPLSSRVKRNQIPARF